MVKHTPGPWDYDMGDFSIYALNDGTPIAAIDNEQHGNEADAQLIAAAPELLAALEYAEGALIGRGATLRELAVVRAAINKAEGRS